MMKHLFDSLTLTVAIISFFFVLGNVTMAQDQVKIFSLLKPDLEPQQGPPELHDPRIYGLSWRFKWSTIEPQQDQYNWQPIDKAIEVSSKAGKKVMLRVIAGINTPEWVYQSGANPFYFSNTDLGRSENYPSSLRMPIPWDDIYLAKWEGFIRAFGMRYNRNPHIYSIQMTGGGYIGEMNLPKAHTKWQQAGYSDAKLIMAWKRIIDSYQKAFPDIPTNLAINEPLGGKRSDVLAPIVSYVLINYPHKVYLQQNGLQANFPRDSRIRQIIREASGKTVVGYQMLGGKEFLEGQTGDRIIAFRNAREDHVSYLEVYASDVRDPSQKEALQFLSTGSERR